MWKKELKQILIWATAKIPDANKKNTWTKSYKVSFVVIPTRIWKNSKKLTRSDLYHKNKIEVNELM